MNAPTRVYYFITMDTTQIIILAAGKGSRMGGDIPKALTTLGSQSMLEHVLDTIESLQTPNVPIVVVGYKEEMIRDQISGRAVFATQHEQKGTGHAVSSAMPLVGPHIEHIVILFADQPFVSGATIKEIVSVKKDSKNPLSIATALIDDENLFKNQFHGFGRIIRDINGDIEAIIESKDATENQKEIREVNPAYFCCDVPWVTHALSGLQNNNAQGEYYLTDLVNMAFLESGSIDSVQINEREALGANTPEQLEILTSYL